MTDNVVRLNRLSEADYDRERQRLRETYGDSNAEAAAKRDQALALLFAKSGWTQEELAAKEGKSQSYIGKRLRFGQFLMFSPTGLNAESLPSNLTERRFREFWEQTNKTDNDRKRYGDAIKAIQSAPVAVRSQANNGLARRIVDEFADGKWHAEETIFNHFADDDAEAIRSSLQHMVRPPSVLTHTNAEREKRGSRHYVRMFKQGKMISNTEIKEKLAPLIKGLIEEGKKSSVTMSPGTVARFAALLKRHLDEWSE